MGAERELHETNKYKDAAFPVGMYAVTRDSIFPRGRGYMDLHWHEELQLTLVTDGGLTVEVNGRPHELKEGEAIFINRNCLHITTELTDAGRYISFNFPEKLLGFFSGSRMEQDDVLPFTGQSGLPALVIRPENGGLGEVIRDLYRLEEMFLKRGSAPVPEGPAPFFEYGVSLLLAGIWHRLLPRFSEASGAASPSGARKQERIRRMLTFIHENYMNPIRLGDIAASASVSVGECCRCFQEMVRKSPNQYLVTYRVSRGMELLSSGEKTVTEAALETGFNDASHFIQFFKRQTGMTPNAYRKKQNC